MASKPQDVNEVCKIVFPIMERHGNLSLRGLLRVLEEELGLKPARGGAFSRAYNKYRRGERLEC